MASADLENLILRVIERWAAGRYTERHGLVTSFDGKNYLAKVTFQPEGQESGWLPIETGHIGKGYGIVIGLQPGSGGQYSGGGSGISGSSSSEAMGDQVIVRYQEGDIESGKIVQRCHSEQDTPPPVNAGEILIWTKFNRDQNAGPDAASSGQSGSQGQQCYFKNDGSILITDGNGATVTLDGKGNAAVNAKKITLTGSDNITVTSSKTLSLSGQTVNISSQGATTVTAQSALNLNGAPINFNGGGPTTSPFTVPG
jgi:hypothetical protein